MNRTILVTRPSHDQTTRCISAWAGEVLDFAVKRGDTVIDLAKDRANRKEFESVLDKKDPSMVFFNGHGDESRVGGQDNETLVDTQNSSRLSGKVVYALACKSGQLLGPVSIEHGTAAYVGYNEDFIFMTEPDKRTHPLDDKTAALFMGPSNQVVISLLKGQTAQEAHIHSRKAFFRSIRKLMTSKTSLADSSALRFLYWDATVQACYGDGRM
ncbi:MAG: hypothetical protein A2122_00925 [Candidatus Liptonbacteria bacterium GWB1_49_6]|uniref:Gingipain domain-containing protein n=1 Tax=Candidatus Liptonbacteria bacterium GWB1_49_6 TaxID=1798644 RepID=A0A1G2C7Q3_9BACT|nr:MAG: hypothetical protein A2122_00925 [Candidatus Liptonbacteria bacterium GWB1_49_6]